MADVCVCHVLQKSRTMKLLKSLEDRQKREAPHHPRVNKGFHRTTMAPRTTEVQHEYWRLYDKHKQELRRRYIESELKECSFKPVLNKVCGPRCLASLVHVSCRLPQPPPFSHIQSPFLVSFFIASSSLSFHVPYSRDANASLTSLGCRCRARWTRRACTAA